MSLVVHKSLFLELWHQVVFCHVVSLVESQQSRIKDFWFYVGKRRFIYVHIYYLI